MSLGVLMARRPNLWHGFGIRTGLRAVCILVGRQDLQGGVKPAPIAQSAERLHGKEKVCGSIPHGGSVRHLGATAHRRNTARVDVRCPVGMPAVTTYGGIAQAVEQAAHNRCVAGSSPAPATGTTSTDRI